MNAYKKFAYYNDEITKDLDYHLWEELTLHYLKIGDSLLDCCCGTGTFLELMSKHNYKLYGFDLSEEAIEIAKEKAKLNRLNIEFKILDMLDFNYDLKFDVITCYFDSINFLSSKELVNIFIKNVYNNLKIGGYFIFDCFSKFFMDEYQDNKIEGDYGNFYLKWYTSKINSKTLHHKIKIDNKVSVINEDYYEYYYDLNDFDFSNFKLIKVVGDFNDDLESEDERIIYILQKIA